MEALILLIWIREKGGTGVESSGLQREKTAYGERILVGRDIVVSKRHGKKNRENKG